MPNQACSISMYGQLQGHTQIHTKSHLSHLSHFFLHTTTKLFKATLVSPLNMIEPNNELKIGKLCLFYALCRFNQLGLHLFILAHFLGVGKVQNMHNFFLVMAVFKPMISWSSVYARDWLATLDPLSLKNYIKIYEFWLVAFWTWPHVLW